MAIHSDFALFCWHEFRPRAISNRFQELLIAYLVIIVCYKVLKNLSWTALTLNISKLRTRSELPLYLVHESLYDLGEEVIF